jgi:hypothetical protein
MRPFAIACCSAALTCCATVAPGQVQRSDAAPSVRLAPVPRIPPRPIDPPPQQRAEMERLIASLAEIDSPDFGFSATMSGSAFAPVEQLTDASALLLTDHRLKRSDSLRKLVALGPAALPHLLRALDDKTPTKMTIRGEDFIGGMSFAREMDSNPVHTIEQRVLRGWRHGDPFGSERTTNSYTVKLGDVCFVAVGQIVGRRYSAVRYQPTAVVIINSPVEEPKLARAVRDIWDGADARKTLLESLLTDYSSRGVFDGQSLDRWDVGSGLQVRAATRLLYYFPGETAPMIADRLNKLDVSRTGPPSAQPATPAELKTGIEREVRNGVRTADFVKAVAWCEEPTIVAAMKSIEERAGDPDVREVVRDARKPSR